MDHFQRLRYTVRATLFVAVAVENAALIGIVWALHKYTDLGLLPIIGAGVVLGSLLAWLVTTIVSQLVLAPMGTLWQAVLHLNPTEHGTAAPQLDQLKMGRELVASLTAQIYQLANVAGQAELESQRRLRDLHQNFIAQNLPLPLFVLDAAETITFANQAAAHYIGINADDMIGKNVYMALDMSFPSEETFDHWLKSVKVKSATAAASWERVRLDIREDRPLRLFDLAAYYNRDNPEHHETLLVMFDHTKEYSQDEQAVSFIALSVHELRTPLTLLRGYIEVFEEELSGTMTPELQNFMQKMQAQADQLTAFVNNILNVARVDADQLELKLHSEDWSSILKSAVEMMSLRAKVRNIKLQCRIATDLPPVGADPLSIREVINNLIDNAIKYSGDSKVIQIETHLNQEGLIETTIQDFGLGISSSILPNLFTKFYRDHRNRAQIGGTGLGLYLSKAILTAHGGDIWVRSKEGEGSTFGFTLLPYTQLAETQKQTGDQDKGIMRSASGWIKNHSLYRR
jgi:signal transduction histidine kinase